MDPQQRLMLELGWEVFEDAGWPAGRFRRSDTGVFVGSIGTEYATVVHDQGPAALTPHSLTGLLRGGIANRVSCSLGLRGPSLVVDSGQSSSLVALHLAAESMRRGECSAAVAGRVNLILTPEGTLRVRRVAPGRRTAAGRVGEDQHRPPRRRCRHRGAHQDRTVPAPRGVRAEPQLRGTQPAHRPRRTQAQCAARGRGMDLRAGPGGRGQLLRYRRHQRAHHPGAGPGRRLRGGRRVGRPGLRRRSLGCTGGRGSGRAVRQVGGRGTGQRRAPRRAAR